MGLVRSATLATLAIHCQLSKGREPLRKAEKEFPKLWRLHFFLWPLGVTIARLRLLGSGPLSARAMSSCAARLGRLALLSQPITYYRALSVQIRRLPVDVCHSSDASDMLNTFPDQNATPVKTLRNEVQLPLPVTLSAASRTGLQISDSFQFPFLDELVGLR